MENDGKAKTIPRVVRSLWCNIGHRRHWFWYGHGDWRIQSCRKCHDRWVVPALQVRGVRREPND